MTASFGAGAWLLKILELYNGKIFTNFNYLLSVTIGLGILSYSTLILGLLGLLNSKMIWGMLVLFSVFGIYLLSKGKK